MENYNNQTTAPYALDGAQESSFSAVSWQAILAGAAASVAVSLALVLAGSSLGLASMSPWENAGASATALSIGAIAFMMVMQWASSALGGYLTGRLRSKWTAVHTDEVFFRDTAHGFLTWCVATIVTVAFLASTVSAVISGGAQVAGASVAAGSAAAAANSTETANTSDPMNYFIDAMFRSDRPSTNASNAEVNAEVSRILVMDLKNDNVPAEDRAYLSRVVANRTGLSEAEASQRVDQTITQIKDAEVKAKQAADKARKATATVSLLTFFSLILGAFVAAVAAALGGRHRYEV